ncbi:hypothetical protein XM25_09340 [Devosia sp. H5989]|nr:hypothetical protein XM25_09340 [Devosia sp. H5989]
MTQITDEFMQSMLPKARVYAAVLLKAGPNYATPQARPIVWEHARRNFALRAEGSLVLVGPVSDGSELCGIGIFETGLDEARALMEEDPGVKAGVFAFEVHPWTSFPGDGLPQHE